LLAVGQSLAMYLQIVTDYGFSLAGVREVARHRPDRGRLAQIFASVLGAKALLLLPASLLALLAYLLLPALRGQVEVAFSALFWAAAWGLSPVWFFQGLERMAEVAFLEVLTRGLATLGVFLLVQEPGQAYLPLLLNGLGALVATALGTLWAVRGFGLPRPGLRGIWAHLRLGGSMFFFRSVVTLYTAANPILLSLFVPPAQVGLYAGAERLTKAILALVEPLNRAFLPRLAHLVRQDRGRGGALATRLFWSMGGIALLGALGCYLLAPLGTALLLGPGYEGAVPLMRILALLLPLVALSNLLGLQWMLALGLDRPFNAIILGAGVLNLLLGSLFAFLFGAPGLAWAVVLAEASVTGGMLLYLGRKGLLPWEVVR
ncbi:oligosaccharide flippase family protein, partial [Thermus sp.]|uniref:oligosaccharide flippase family protein n=1 Tax=Thermus sp. TaxID=275 RepID=UPI0025D3D9BB